MKHGNIHIARRVVTIVLLFAVVFTAMIPRQIVKADDSIGQITLKFSKLISSDNPMANFNASYSFSGLGSDSLVFLVEDSYDSSSFNNFYPVVVSKDKLDSLQLVMNQTSDFGNDYGKIENQKCSLSSYHSIYGAYVYYSSNVVQVAKNKDLASYSGGTAPYFYLNNQSKLFYDGFENLAKYLMTGEKIDGLQVGYGGASSDYQVNANELGYLKNLKMNFANTYAEHSGSQNITNTFFNFKWDTDTTLKIDVKDYNNPTDSDFTGIDLSDQEYLVQSYAVVEYTPEDENASKVTDNIALDSISARKGKFKIDMNSLRSKATNCNKAYASDHPVLNWFNNGHRWVNIKFYFRVYTKHNKYGPWLQCYHNLTYKDNVTYDHKSNVKSGGFDDSGNFKTDGNIDTTTNGVHASGGNEEEADENMKYQEKKQEDTSNTTFDNLESFVSGIGSVPEMVADIFSFLPSWCLQVCAIGFGLMITLLVIKFIRG